MIGLVFATLEEAAPLLKQVKQIMKSDFPFPKYTFSLNRCKVIVTISGIGKVAAALATQNLILTSKPLLVINAGICGAVTDDVKIGQIYRITEVREGDLYEEFSSIYSCHYNLLKDESLTSKRLTTRDMPVYDKILRQETARWGELVDMEGAAIVRTCHLYHLPCVVIKGVTDFADAAGKEAIQRHLTEVAANLAAVLLDNFSRLEISVYE